MYRPFWFVLVSCCFIGGIVSAQVVPSTDAADVRGRVDPETVLPTDPRDGQLVNLNGYFPFHSVGDIQDWNQRRKEIRKRILVSQGLWPLPTRAPLNAVIHGRVEREDYVVDRVHFESAPGHYVTAALYRPKGKEGPFPAILSPHGHWNQGRFHDAGENQAKSQIEIGAEEHEPSARFLLQTRAVQLARMGCIVLFYDMTGNADSIQISHRPAAWSHLDTPKDWGFMSVQADLRLQNMMGLQTWNSIRAIDFLLQLEDVDATRIGVTGASGGGTQSMLISAIDDRIAAAMPCVMVSTSMQGGCTCENAPLLRIDQGNIDIAAATAPRPLGLTAADDWTIELENKGYSDLLKLYTMLGHPDRLTAVFHTRFKHNYNGVNRAVMYSFFNRHFRLGLDEPIEERPYQPLTREEATVWTDDHPAPDGDRVGDQHEIRLLRIAAADSDRQMEAVVATAETDPESFQTVVAGGWQVILGRQLGEVGKVRFVPNDATDAKAADQTGTVHQIATGEQVKVRRFQPKNASRGTVVLATDHGLSSLQPGGEAVSLVERLTGVGYTVLAADLYQQDNVALQAQPMWYQPKADQGWKRFSGYTYGYNHSHFVKRVHDLLTVLAFAKAETNSPIHQIGPIHLIGLGPVAGPLALAARSQSGDHIDHTVIDLQGFQFQQVRRHDDLMFVPGSVKYLDVDGLLAVCAPSAVDLFTNSKYPVADKIYTASTRPEALRLVPTGSDVVELIAR